MLRLSAYIYKNVINFKNIFPYFSFLFQNSKKISSFGNLPFKKRKLKSPLTLEFQYFLQSLIHTVKASAIHKAFEVLRGHPAYGFSRLRR